MSDQSSLRLGTRASPLAQWQANWVAAQLAELGVRAELVLISTEGDQRKTGPIGTIGTQGVFTKELQRALLEGQIDLIVHSLKDLPTDRVEGLELAAVPMRGPEGDALVSHRADSLAALGQGALVGTGSLRRKSQLWHIRPDLKIQDVRGNVETRLRKLADGEMDALVLAEAGLVRLGLEAEIRQILPKHLVLPAVGQGALGIEARSGDARTKSILSRLDHPATRAAVSAERSMLAALRGGCLAPVGAWGRVGDEGRLHMDGVVLSADGRQRLFAAGVAELNDADVLGKSVAGDLLAQGAADLIRASRS